MQSQQVGNSRNESLNKTPILEMEFGKGHTVPSGFWPINSMQAVDSYETSGCCEPASGAPRLRRPVTGDYLSPGQPPRQSWKRHTRSERSDSTGPTGREAVGFQKRQILEIVSSLPPLSQGQALFSPGCL